MLSTHSGRMRQEGSGVASIQLLVDDTIHTSLANPNPDNVSWQWVSKRVKVVNGTIATLALTVKNQSSSSGAIISGVAFFDDLCMTFKRVDRGGSDGMCVCVCLCVCLCVCVFSSSKCRIHVPMRACICTT